MHTEMESEYKDWAFGAIVTVLLVACFACIYGYSNAPAEVAPLTSPRSIAGVTSPSPQLAALRSSTQSNLIAEVYECEKDGQRILSDQICGPSANVLKVMAPNRMDAQDTGSLHRDYRSSRSYSTSRPRQVSYEYDSSICQSIERQIDAINARMRQSYTSQDGERFRSRLRQLSDERHDARCIH